MSDYPFNFQAEIVRYAFGKMEFTVVFVPAELVPKLPLDKHPRLRIEGEVDGIQTGDWPLATSDAWSHRLAELAIED